MSGKKVTMSPVAGQIPFDNEDNGFDSDNVQAAIEEVPGVALDKPRALVFFWDWNAFPIYLYLFGQVRSNDLPFAVGQNGKLRELTCGGRQNNVNANAIFALYRITDPSTNPNLGSLPEVVNQNLTYIESDFPYTGTSRVTINLVNNGPSLPLIFSEDLVTKTVTIQLATNAGGNVTTTRTQLRNAFRLNTDITLIYAINGSGGNVLSTASFSTSGGSVGDAIGAVFMRAKAFGFRKGYEVQLSPGDFLVGRAFNQNVNSFSPSSLTAYLSFDV